jgi:hypothetical protein
MSEYDALKRIARRQRGPADAIRRDAAIRREDVIARQRIASTPPEPEPYSWKPQRPWHVYELIRTVAALFQAAATSLILARVFGLL